ncbi:unnamed protein product [Somion occarium]|uniref:AAA+ ATPase domain-containing protein n=1 Tax=Somion occarium TaxID=3059160 RepID=A0ABP1D930_9APHY
MRSQFLVRRTRSLLKTPSVTLQRALISSTRPKKYPRKVSVAPSSKPPVSERSSSSVALSHSGPPASPDAPDTPPADDSNETLTEEIEAVPEEVEKPKRRTRTSNKEAVDTPPPPIPLPGGLDILWAPDAPANAESQTSSSDPALPPPEILEEILTNLHVTLHPQTQHKATYAISGPTIEPTFALYCPIEGGDYILDATVREMGRQVGADVVVLDAVQFAAGESGQFGKAAVFNPPQNPLHFHATTSQPSPRPSEEDDDDDEHEFSPRQTRQLTLHVMTPMSAGRSGRTFLQQRKGPSSTSKLKALFDELINVKPPTSSPEEPPPRRPRIIYIRDFPTLAESSSTWYPALLASVRQRRLGPMARSSSPVFNPTTIVFGITPPLVSPQPRPTSPGSGLLQQIMQSRGRSSPKARGQKVDYGENEEADKAREKRLMDRLRRWQKGDSSLHNDIPRLATSSATEESDNSDGSPEIVVLGGGEGIPGIAQFAQALTGRGKTNESSQPSSEPSTTPFFRTSIVVPSQRLPAREKECRMARRREINELTMRMGVAAVGGVLGKLELDVSEPDAQVSESNPESLSKKVLEDWGQRIELWPDVRQIADRAVGAEIANQRDTIQFSLEPIHISWSTIFQALDAYTRQSHSRKSWIQQSIDQTVEEEGEDGEKAPKKEVVDEVVQQIKRDAEDGELDQYEQRLVRCIVDPTSLKTTFSQVHLPPHTIDSVRTIVSLPLLHPSAFQSGILKEHSMTGCLLFGPPGTGKTLVVRALAKEAGTRMLLVQPSDVMDMYYGEAEKLVRAVFALARRLAPCVVFIDEIDALFGARERGGGDYAHRGTITEFMQEMDGLRSSKDDNIIVIGATNRPFDLDDAVLRRLPRRLLVDLPGEKEREGILKILLRDEQLETDVDLNTLARKTESFSGSDLKHLCVAAALDAVKEGVSLPWRPSPPNTNVESLNPAASAAIPVELLATPELETPSLSSSSPVSESAQTTCATDIGSSEPAAASSKPSTIEKPGQGSTQIHKPVEQLTARGQDSASSASSSSSTSTPTLPEAPPRKLSWRNFEVALKEITPSSSEALASLNDLRKWNDEFGEGRKGRKKHVWGKDKFGFTGRPLDGGNEVKIGRS